MRKLTIGFLTLLVLIIGSYIVWWNLPLTINRSSDIKLGEKIIENIEKYQRENDLPNDNDWKILKRFGFRDKIDFLQPEYRKLDEKNFELVYVEGFDGPYLMWNSRERKWKEDYPTFEKPN
ncbi:hypothetical protein [Flavobacterium sp.]|uniref:hypothetical protein n=1 Tax=Flavobacterium sp. TaxID=239 RepID=UPI0025BB69C7|nr:hypothetical protein [Flavobacterium sp.]